MGRRKIGSKHEGPDIEATANADLEAGTEPTFAEAKGSEANQHAKKLAQEKAKRKPTPANTFYTKKGDKVLKIIAKPGKAHSVYVGNLKKPQYKVALEAMIKSWQKENVWLHEHEAKEKISAACAKLAAEVLAKPKKK